jgi:DNA-binding response OmpR family regulator
MTKVVFVVEVSSPTCRLAVRYLEQAGYFVRVFSPENAIEVALAARPSLMLIAASPENCGLELCRSVRENAALALLPVLVVIEGAAEEDGIAAMEAGADDCLSQPLVHRELIARVQSLLRRLARRMPIPISETTDIVIDNAAMKLSVRGDEVATTTLQFRLVDYLARHRGQVFTRDVLLDAVWGEMQFVNPRSVDACIRRVRNKIEPDAENPTYLKTIRGVGYRFDAVAAWPNSNEPCNCSACVASFPVSGISFDGRVRRKRFASQH